MPELALVHLVWAPLGPPALERFATAYRALPAGLPHRLAVIFKGFAAPGDAAAHAALLEGLDYDSMFYDQPTFDLPAYAAAAETFEASHFCFLNSESVPLAPDWLGSLAGDLLADPRIGLAAATASYERPHSYIPTRRRRWPRFPNPHVRTNAFALSRDLMRSAAWPEIPTKARAWELESGTHGLTRHIWNQGFETLVAGRGGALFRPHEWPASATFRSGDQGNLLVADNRTREWEAAAPAERAKLSRFAWGRDPAAAAAEVERATAASTA